MGSPPKGALSRTSPSPAEMVRKRQLARRRMEKRRFHIAFVLALLFHLSMITVFQIVIYFPRNDTEYYSVNLVSSTSVSPYTTAKSSDTLALSGGAELHGGLPEVDLPVIEFAEIDRLRIRYDASEPLQDLDRFFGPARPTDSWARFGGELHRLGRSLRDLALPGDEGAASAAKKQHTLSHRPAEGFEAYIEWNGPPMDRELLFAPPIKALWEVSPASVTRPLEIVFKVSPSGRVTNVWSPMIEENGLIDDVQMTLLQYRFAPLANYTDTPSPATPDEQSGVLFIKAGEGAS